MGFLKKTPNAAVSQSVVGRANAVKQNGIRGMLANPYVFMTCLFASLGCMMYGYDQGVMGSILVMENFQAHFPTLTGSSIQGWLVASLELGAWAGALLNGYLADRISRKYSMLVAVIVFTLGTGLQTGAQNPAMLFAGRVIGAFWLDYGMHFVGGSNCDPAGVPNHGYGSDGKFSPSLAHGHNCTGEEAISWRVPLALQLIPAWILFFGMFFLPFSPRWLMMKHRDDDCIASLSKLRRLEPDNALLRAEYLEIKAALLATGVTGILQIIFTLPAVLFLDKFGRKSFLITGAVGMCVCHVIVAALDGTFEDSWPTHTSAGWASIAFIWLFAVNFAYSWGPVTWVLTQEIFPNSMRSRGVAIVASTNWMFNFVIGLTTRDMLDSMKYGTYIFFAAFCAGGALFVWALVPETKNKTLEELDIYFGGDNDSIAVADKARMQRIEESLGLAGVQTVEDLKTEKTVGHDEHEVRGL
ncbi:Sugar transport protein 7 [Lachnellula arida]|uniref:Sugar transport protein 7 n=1 Tax=Lachnellula arida TaxID=1316785 RepID=A0A8T9B1I6_9HELO|nr:Sugar transport protein 7 [Lachnellula arida]